MNLKEKFHFIATSKELRAIVSGSLAISTAYILLILYFTHGALLYGGDFVGFYSSSQILANPSPNSIVFSIGITLALGNYYAGMYIALLLSSFVSLLSIFFFSREIFKDSLAGRQVLIIGIISSILYLFNPVSYTNTFKSLISNLYVENAAFFVFLAEVIILWRHVKKNTMYRHRDAFVLGLSLALSSDAFPNNVRTIIIGLGITLYFLTVGIFSEHARISFGIPRVLKLSGLALLGLFVGGFYYIVPLITDLSSYSKFASQGANSLSSLSFIVGPFNTLPQVLRLVGAWSFSSGYAPYANLYFQSPIVIFVSFLWPILALGFPVLLARGMERKIIFPLEFLMIIMIFWEKASNPPLGWIWSYAVAHLPFGPQLFPTFFVTTLALSKLYPIMAAYSIAKIATIRVTFQTSQKEPIRAHANLLLSNNQGCGV